MQIRGCENIIRACTRPPPAVCLACGGKHEAARSVWHGTLWVLWLACWLRLPCREFRAIRAARWGTSVGVDGWDRMRQGRLPDLRGHWRGGTASQRLLAMARLGGSMSLTKSWGGWKWLPGWQLVKPASTDQQHLAKTNSPIIEVICWCPIGSFVLIFPATIIGWRLVHFLKRSTGWGPGTGVPTKIHLALSESNSHAW